jgi:Family of unknown function (DUF6188)
MFGLSKSTDLSFFVGRQLVQVCVGMYQVILRFDEETSVSLECDCQIIPQLPQRMPAYSIHASACLLRVIGDTVTSTNNVGNGDISLEFSNGCSLFIFDSNDDSESYQINHGSNILIV